MKKLIKNIFKEISPPLISRFIRKYTEQLTFSGSYSTWQEAQASSKGYNDSAIIDKALTAALSVKDGKAAYGRDSVLFNEIEYSWPLLAGLMLAASFREKVFSVLDFGGSFGTTYFQNKKFLDGIGNVEWHIVEQAEFVRRGKENIENEYLLFHESIVSALASAGHFDAIVLSSVLQYVENPESILEELIQLNAPVIIIDRTPVWNKKNDRIVIQYVPEAICKSTYPARVFSEGKFLNFFSEKYQMIESFLSLDGKHELTNPEAEFEFKGFILAARNIKRENKSQ